MATNKWMAAFWGAAVAMLLAAVPAMASDRQGAINNYHGENGRSRGQVMQNGQATHAPEFDPAVAGVIGAIVAGGGLLLARRRRS